MTGTPRPTVSSLAGDDLDSRLAELAGLLQDCVHAGASIGFVLPFPLDEAAAFWRDAVFPAVRAGARILLVVEVEGRIRGTAQLIPAPMPNQPHRAEVGKLMVHPGHRRLGLARLLMAELEHEAGRAGRRLLTLDTRTGDMAEPLYAALGYRTAGVIPGYCLAPEGGRLDATTIMYKTL